MNGIPRGSEANRAGKQVAKRLRAIVGEIDGDEPVVRGAKLAKARDDERRHELDEDRPCGVVPSYADFERGRALLATSGAVLDHYEIERTAHRAAIAREPIDGLSDRVAARDEVVEELVGSKRHPRA